MVQSFKDSTKRIAVGYAVGPFKKTPQPLRPFFAELFHIGKIFAKTEG
jgi:hypothetical protein